MRIQDGLVLQSLLKINLSLWFVDWVSAARIRDDIRSLIRSLTFVRDDRVVVDPGSRLRSLTSSLAMLRDRARDDRVVIDSGILRDDRESRASIG